MINFYSKMTGLVHEGRATDMVSFSKAFTTLFEESLIEKLMKYRLDE